MWIVFVVDTSGSMNQRSGGLTLLDAAKAAIEHFVKQRERDPLARTDRYFLITTEDGLQAVKSGWKESYATFIQEVKNLQAKDLTNLGQALKRAFDLLNQYRLQNGIDNYGQGRLPWFVEPASIIILTDGCALTSTSGVLDTLTVPLNPMSGSELTLEPFRWDQRVFSFLLQFSGKIHTLQILVI
jgi:integrator complex subunit 6